MTITPVSNWLGNLVKESILKEHKIQVIHNGIDLDLFKPCLSNIKERIGIGKDKK